MLNHNSDRRRGKFRKLRPNGLSIGTEPVNLAHEPRRELKTQKQSDEMRTREIVAELFGVSPSTITLATRWVEDLDGDALDFLEVLTIVESEFAIKVPEGRIIDVTSSLSAWNYTMPRDRTFAEILAYIDEGRSSMKGFPRKVQDDDRSSSIEGVPFANDIPARPTKRHVDSPPSIAARPASTIPVATTGNQSWASMEDEVLLIVADQFGLPKDQVTPITRWVEDLDGDVLDFIETVAKLEEAFGVKIPDRYVPELQLFNFNMPHSPTIAELLQYVAEQIPYSLAQAVEQAAVMFRLDRNGDVRAAVRMAEGTWTFAGSASELASAVYLAGSHRWRSVLVELEDLINDRFTTEQELQEFLLEHNELLRGDEYDQVISQACIVRSDAGAPEMWRADFVLAPFDQERFCRIIELKRPVLPILRTPRHGHPQFYKRLWEGITQLKDYGAAFDDESVRRRFRQQYDIDVFKPELQLIAGRSWDLNLHQGMKELQRRYQVEVVDWDSYLRKLRRQFLKRWIG